MVLGCAVSTVVIALGVASACGGQASSEVWCGPIRYVSSQPSSVDLDTAKAVLARHSQEIMTMCPAVGAGVGPADPSRGFREGGAAIVVYTTEDVDQRLRALEAVPVRVVQTGEFRAL